MFSNYFMHTRVNIELVVIVTMKLTKSDAKKKEKKNEKNSLFLLCIFFFSFFIHRIKWHI